MELVELKIHGISYSDNSSAAFALILDEVNGNKKLPIVIGGFEAQSIAIALEKKIKTSRPLTHELFKGCLLYTSPSPRDGLLSRMPSSA